MISPASNWYSHSHGRVFWLYAILASFKLISPAFWFVMGVCFGYTLFWPVSNWFLPHSDLSWAFVLAIHYFLASSEWYSPTSWFDRGICFGHTLFIVQLQVDLLSSFKLISPQQPDLFWTHALVIHDFASFKSISLASWIILGVCFGHTRFRQPRIDFSSISWFALGVCFGHPQESDVHNWGGRGGGVVCVLIELIWNMVVVNGDLLTSIDIK